MCVQLQGFMWKHRLQNWNVSKFIKTGLLLAFRSYCTQAWFAAGKAPCEGRHVRVTNRYSLPAACHSPEKWCFHKAVLEGIPWAMFPFLISRGLTVIYCWLQKLSYLVLGWWDCVASAATAAAQREGTSWCCLRGWCWVSSQKSSSSGLWGITV